MTLNKELYEECVEYVEKLARGLEEGWWELDDVYEGLSQMFYDVMQALPPCYRPMVDENHFFLINTDDLVLDDECWILSDDTKVLEDGTVEFL